MPCSVSRDGGIHEATVALLGNGGERERGRRGK